MANEDRPAMPWYVKDWLTSEDRHAMTYEERGVYRDLLDHSWLERGIPSDKETLRRMLGLEKRKFALIWGTLSQHWVERDSRLYNEKQERVRAEMDDFRAARSEAGRRGADARWHGKPDGKPDAVALAKASDGNAKPMAKAWPSSSSAFPIKQQPRYEGQAHSGHLFGFCNFKCLSEQKVREFSQDLPGGATEANFTKALKWAESVRDGWGDKPKLEAKWYAFWEARWAERPKPRPVDDVEARGAAAMDAINARIAQYGGAAK